MRLLLAAGLAMLAVPLAAALSDPVRPPEGRLLLPDLASLPPDGFTFVAPDGRTDTGGCLEHEREQGARRCLRFTTYLTNVGEGLLDLGVARGPAGGRSGPGLMQRLHSTDGSWLERPAGLAEYHGIHDHYHVAGLVSFTLHALDGDGVAASNSSAAGGKTGFCLFDGARGEGATAARTFHRWNCKALDRPGVGMGITPGWVDRYNWTLADQYLEVSGVPDGLYRLTVVADPGHLVIEAGRGNNEASVVLRLAGGDVLVAGVLPTERP